MGDRVNAYKLIGDKANISETTVRAAFARQPVTLYTARCIAKACGIDVDAFRIKPDGRGRKPMRRGARPQTSM